MFFLGFGGRYSKPFSAACFPAVLVGFARRAAFGTGRRGWSSVGPRQRWEQRSYRCCMIVVIFDKHEYYAAPLKVK